jgi:hypothetical protein
MTRYPRRHARVTPPIVTQVFTPVSLARRRISRARVTRTAKATFPHASGPPSRRLAYREVESLEDVLARAETEPAGPGVDSVKNHAQLLRSAMKAAGPRNLDRLLDTIGVRDDLHRMLTWELRDNPNGRVKQAGHQHPDLLILLVKRLGLPEGWHREVSAETELDGVVEAVVNDAASFLVTAIDLIDERLGRKGKQVPSPFRHLANRDEIELRLRRFVLSELAATPTGGAAFEAEEMLLAAEQQYLCRWAVIRGALSLARARMSAPKLGQEQASAWIDAAAAIHNEYRRIVPQGGSPKPRQEGLQQRTEIYCREVGDHFDRDVLGAVIAYTIGVHGRRRSREFRGAVEFEALLEIELGKKGEPPDERTVGGRGPHERPELLERYRLLLSNASTAGRAEVKDFVRILFAAETLTGDGLAWLFTHYEPVSSGEELALFWSLAQATRPSRVYWSDYALPSARQRKFVSRVADSFRDFTEATLAEEL